VLTDCFAAEHNQTLELYGLRSPADTGAYKCTARNVAGSVQDIATVFVQQRAQLTDNERRLRRQRFIHSPSQLEVCMGTADFSPTPARSHALYIHRHPLLCRVAGNTV